MSPFPVDEHAPMHHGMYYLREFSNFLILLLLVGMARKNGRSSKEVEEVKNSFLSL